MSQTTPTAQKEFIISYIELRKFIGVLGISLPFLLAAGTLLLNMALPKYEQPIQPSISHYYYSIMHVVFVGVLCLLSGFLFAYRGKHKLDKPIALLAAVFALGVAAFPTDADGFIPMDGRTIIVSWWQCWVNWIHYGSATLLFVCFAFFCFYIFQDDDNARSKEQFDEKKKKRNNFYKTCGWLILASIGMIGGLTLYENVLGKLPTIISTYNTIFFETTALLAFGSSWLLKGTYKMKKIPTMLQGFR